MYMHILKYIRRAVQSLSACTSLEMVWNGVLAKATRLCSPYVSHRYVEFDHAFTWPDVLLARNTRFGLLLSGVPLSTLEERYGPVGMTQLWALNVPWSNYMSLWYGGRIPQTLVAPILAKAINLFGETFKDARFLYAYAVKPVLAGWHYKQPVYILAQHPTNTFGYSGRPLLEEWSVKAEPIANQGSLEVYNICDQVPLLAQYHEVPHAATWQWLYKHRIGCPDSEGNNFETEENREPAPVFAMRVNGDMLAVTVFDGPCLVQSPDHEPLKLGDGVHLLAHPFPDEGVD